MNYFVVLRARLAFGYFPLGRRSKSIILVEVP
jgi:hypothetical protein